MIDRRQMMAGKMFKEKLSRSVVLSPLPINTNHLPHDGAHIIKTKTDVYLDIGYNNICQGDEGLALGLNWVNITLIIVSIGYFLSSYNDIFPIHFLLSILTGTHVFLFFYMCSYFLSLKKYKFIRFNRQRREVALPFEGLSHEYVIVPWEKLYAWAETGIYIFPPISEIGETETQRLDELFVFHSLVQRCY